MSEWIKVYHGYSKNLKLKETLENDLEDQRAMAFNSAKLASLGEMAAGIAHEINNPLTIINGAAFSLKRRIKKLEVKDESLAKNLSKIEDTTKRIANIVKSIRTISRDGANDDNVKVVLSEIIDEGVFLISEKVKMAQVQLDIETNSCKESCEVYGKATEISQIIMNLISNSIDALVENNVEDKILKLKSYQDHDYIILDIIDNAGGIPEDIVSKIFNPFFTTKEVGKGTGLGLSLSKRIMKEHGGKLELIQANGLTTFRLSFPKNIQDETPKAA